MAKQNKTVKAIEQAERALETSKRKHREAFRKALANTFSQYGLALTSPGSKLAIVTFDASKLELPE